MLKKLILLGVVAFATGCAGPTSRLALSPVQSDLELRSLVSSAMVRTVSLPSYAAAEEIPIETVDGLIAANEDILWADDPERAVTLMITRSLNDILNADVGPDPWPFVGLPDVAIDIRVERMLAGADGVFRLTGQFFVGGDGIDFPNRVRSFDITKPMASNDLSSVANAQAAALLTLSEDIARTLAR